MIIKQNLIIKIENKNLIIKKFNLIKDIWSLGVILYMLVTGRAPFQEANDSETLTMILDCKYYLPPNLSSECSDLICSMLVRDPEKRITLDQICAHSWLKELNEEKDNAHMPLSADEFADDDEYDECCNESEQRQHRTHNQDKVLVKRENLTEKQNNEIIDCMVAGNISNREEIIKYFKFGLIIFLQG
jgi:serine/threonine protein kinase